MILTLIVSVMTGFFTHYTNAVVRRVSALGWRSVTFYIIRSTLKIPAILMVSNDLKDDIKDRQKSVLVSYILASCAYGIGVILGWLIDES